MGNLADQVARRLTAEGEGKMYCLAGLGGYVEGIINSTQSAAKVLVIDGCPLDCAKKTLEHAGFNNFEFIRLTDLGMQKGSTQ